MKIVQQVLNDAFVLKPELIKDDRGYFCESFNKKTFENIIGRQIYFVQDNQSLSSKGTLRGLHFQTGDSAQSKLIRVVKGAVLDVAIDLRPESTTFKKWHSVEITENNHLQFFIPKGFAHAFLSLENNTILQYKVDNFYSKENECGILWNDEELKINWPAINIELSEKDKKLSKLKELDIKSFWK
jgi:dTDP-4-dehydrorhamnose 3,5-epimerase